MENGEMAEQDKSGVVESSKCPHCSGPLHVTAHTAPSDQRMVFSLKPDENGVIALSTIGGVATNLDKMLKSLGRDLGTHVVPCVLSVTTDDDRTMNFEILTVLADGPGKTHRAAAQKRARDASREQPTAPSSGTTTPDASPVSKDQGALNAPHHKDIG